MIIPLVAYSALTALPLPGLTPSLPYFKRRNADGTFTDLSGTVADRGAGNYDFTINDVDLTPGSIVSYVVDFGVSAASRYESSHVSADGSSANVVPFFLFSAATGDPTTGISCSFNYYQRRNADATLTDLIGSAPAILDRGNLLYEFTVPGAQRPTGTAIVYIVDPTAASAARFLDGIVSDPDASAVVTPTNPAPQSPKTSSPFAPWSFGAPSYARQLRQLLPPGKAFSPEVDSVVTAVLDATAQELARVDARGVDLINESDPRTATETIGDWEKFLSLPDDQVVAIPGTLAERRIAVTQKYTNRGGQSRQFFVDLAAACGYTVEDVPLAVPAPSFGAQSFTGGSLHHGVTVAYRVSAYNASGETLASAEISRVLGGVTNTNRQEFDWSAVEGATGYKVYGRAAGTEQLIATLGTVTSYTDTGSPGPSGALPSGVPQPIDYYGIQRFAKSILRAGFRCGDRVYGVAYAYSMLLNVQTPSGVAMAQADFERVIRGATQAHIEAVIFVYH